MGTLQREEFFHWSSILINELLAGGVQMAQYYRKFRNLRRGFNKVEHLRWRSALRKPFPGVSLTRLQVYISKRRALCQIRTNSVMSSLEGVLRSMRSSTNLGKVHPPHKFGLP